MAGQHRIEALKDYVKQTHSDSSDLWWICEFYDKGVTPLNRPQLADLHSVHVYTYMFIYT